MSRTLGSTKLAAVGSSRELAAKLRCSHETARKLQSGTTRPTRRMRGRIAEALGIDPDDFDRPAPEAPRPAPDLSPPAGTIMAGVTVAPGSALAQLREQRDRLLAIVHDTSASERSKLDAERLLTGCLKAIGQVEEQFDRQIDEHLAQLENITFAAIQSIQDPVERKRVARQIREACELLSVPTDAAKERAAA